MVQEQACRFNHSVGVPVESPTGENTDTRDKKLMESANSERYLQNKFPLATAYCTNMWSLPHATTEQDLSTMILAHSWP